MGYLLQDGKLLAIDRMMSNQMANRVLLIVQSPIGIASILQLYVNYIDTNSVTIACIGSGGVHEYLLKLKLNCEVIFMRPVSYSQNRIKYLSRLRAQKITIDRLCKKYDLVFFTSIYQDLYTMSILSKCQKNNINLFRVSTGLDNLHQYANPISSFGKMVEAVVARLIRSIIGVEINFVMISGRYFFSYKNYASIPTIRIEINEEIYERFGIPFLGGSSKNILLIESRGEDAGYFSNYKNNLTELLDKLKLLGAVYIKPHPTHGISRFLEGDDGVKVFDKSTPAVMINLKEFSMVVGIESAALKEMRHTNLISVIDSFEFVNKDVKVNFKRYLKDTLGSEIQFKSTEQLSLISK
jgi:hypothetical protein